MKSVADRAVGASEEDAEMAAARAELAAEAEEEGGEAPAPASAPPATAASAPPDTAEPTVVELAKESSASSLSESAARDALGAKVDSLREELMALIGANEMLAEDDLEKLKPTDFIIDLAQQDEWRAEGTARVEALHKSIVAENLANELVTSRMRDEFWNAMEAPAVTLHGLPVPGQGAPNRQNLQKVVSYTVAKPLEASQARLATVKLLRRVEVNLDVWEAKDSGEEAPNYRPSSSFEDAAGFAHDVAKVITAAEARAAEMAAAAEGGDKKDGDKKDGDKKAEGEEGEAAEDGEEEGKKADVKLLYQPFELHTKWRKISQMSMHGQEVQSKLKRDFNDKLKSMVNYKRAELEKIKERQTRIHEIEDELSRLGSASDGEPTLEMGMHPDEEPEKLLEVSRTRSPRRSGSRPPSANGWPSLRRRSDCATRPTAATTSASAAWSR